jgi:hypothetical protein
MAGPISLTRQALQSVPYGRSPIRRAIAQALSG